MREINAQAPELRAHKRATLVGILLAILVQMKGFGERSLTKT
jgi:hypothetical protein